MIRLWSSCLLLLVLSGCGFRSEEADLVLHNGRVLTLDGELTVAQAVAVKDGLVVAVGTDQEVRRKYRAKRTIDLKGATLVPGLADAHAHVVGYADGLLRADLVGTASWEEAVGRMTELGVEQREGWVVGRGWDQNDWDDTALPTRALLDAAFPDRPAVCERIDGHAVVANAAALAAAGIGADSRFPGGEVVLGADGQPTGVLIDAAASAVQAAIPPLDPEARAEALREAEARLFAAGLTAVTDAGLSWADIQFVDSLQRAGALRLRIVAMASDTEENRTRFLASGPLVTDRLQVRCFKFYMDGALGSRGAALLEPYSDRPGWSGLLVTDSVAYVERITALHAAGFQVATHAIGDRAVRLVIDACGTVLRGQNDARWRIEHAQVVAEEDLARFAAFSLVPSVQPTHATSDAPWAGVRLGRNRVRRAYAYRELKDALGMIAVGTDFPVEDIDPRKTFHAAVARRSADGKPEGGFQTENALSPLDALRGMTVWAALANFQEDRFGTVEVGKAADFTVLDRDWLAEPDRVLESRVLATVIAGEVVYSDGSWLR
jgi:predicted amidohydrolase YtcJ